MRTEILESSEPRYFTTKDRAIEFANTNPGKLWKRLDDAPSSIKPWAFGDLPESRIEWYRLHSVNGRPA